MPTLGHFDGPLKDNSLSPPERTRLTPTFSTNKNCRKLGQSGGKAVGRHSAYFETLPGHSANTIEHCGNPPLWKQCPNQVGTQYVEHCGDTVEEGGTNAHSTPQRCVTGSVGERRRGKGLGPPEPAARSTWTESLQPRLAAKRSGVEPERRSPKAFPSPPWGPMGGEL